MLPMFYIAKDRLFDPAECNSLGGEIYCPKCNCCTLKHPRVVANIFQQIDMIQERKKFKLYDEAEDLWVCPDGCTHDSRHD